MRKLATAIENEDFTSSIGEAFAKLTIPKVYCMAEKGEQLESLSFLKQNKIPVMMLPSNHHFCAQSCSDQFVQLLALWLKEIF